MIRTGEFFLSFGPAPASTWNRRRRSCQPRSPCSVFQVPSGYPVPVRSIRAEALERHRHAHLVWRPRDGQRHALAGASSTINLDATGTLEIGTATTGGLLLGGTGSLVNNGTLIFNRSNASAYSGDLSGSGALVEQDAGTLTLSGSNGFTGGTTLTFDEATGRLVFSSSTPAGVPEVDPRGLGTALALVAGALGLAERRLRRPRRGRPAS